MDFTTHQLVKGAINKSMASYDGFSGKLRRNYKQAIVATAALGASVTGMFGRIVNQIQSQGFEFGQTLTQDGINSTQINLRGRLAHAGRTFLKGLTLTLA